jgi:putative IMPACT (imprinted ancient) family translation regulator
MFTSARGSFPIMCLCRRHDRHDDGDPKAVAGANGCTIINKQAVMNNAVKMKRSFGDAIAGTVASVRNAMTAFAQVEFIKLISQKT